MMKSQYEDLLALRKISEDTGYPFSSEVVRTIITT